MRTYTVTEYDKEDYDAVRENMTDNEVLSILKGIERGRIPDYDFTGTEDDYEYYKLHIALWKAMDAIEARMKGK